MIISHKYKFIFIKTEKTAGTSVEIAFSKYLDRRDIITPLTLDDERIRIEKGYRGAQNYVIPLRHYLPADWKNLFLRQKRLSYFNHASADFVRRHIEADIWNSYFKFCFERNPWDKVVSYYYWLHQKEPRPSISEFIQSGSAKRVRGIGLYTSGNQILVDKIYMFENLHNDMEEIASTVGLPEVPELPRAKATQRCDNRSYRQILNEFHREQISHAFAREIAYLGYQW